MFVQAISFLSLDVVEPATSQKCLAEVVLALRDTYFPAEEQIIRFGEIASRSAPTLPLRARPLAPWTMSTCCVPSFPWFRVHWTAASSVGGAIVVAGADSAVDAPATSDHATHDRGLVMPRWHRLVGVAAGCI